MNLRQITRDIILLMSESILWENLRANRGYEGDPTAWDINCGYCEEWAEHAAKRFGGEAVWMDKINPNFGDDGLSVRHCVLILNGRYYDSQHPDGVDSPWDMDIVNDVSREDFLGKL